MKTEWLISINTNHVKVTPITLEQYLLDQLSKHIGTDTLEDIPKHTENHVQEEE